MARADKHGVPHEDALHAIEHAVYVEVEFDEPRLGGRVRPTLFIAAAAGAWRVFVGGGGGDRRFEGSPRMSCDGGA